MKSKLGIWSFILSLLAVLLILGSDSFFSSFSYNKIYFFLFIILPIVSIVFSIISLNEIKKKNLEGKRYALFGLIISILLIVIVPLLFLIFVFTGGGPLI
jgi:hypothetical protein